MTTIAIANQKGGCGKTTTAINLSASLGRKTRGVLLVDMDPQGHATLGLGAHCEKGAGFYEVLLNEAALEDVIVPGVAPGVDLVPATISLAAVEHLLAGVPQRERQLALHLGRLPQLYDFVIIDSPPALGVLSFNVLRSADRIIVPIDMDTFALDGIERLCETVTLLAEKYDLDIPIHVLPTFVDRRTRFTRLMLEEIRERFPNEILPVSIHHTVRLREAAYRGRPVADYAPHAPASEDYERLAEEVINQCPGEFVGATAPGISPTATEGRTASRAVERQPPVELDGVDGALTSSDIYGEAKKRVTLFFRDLDNIDLQIAGEFNDWVPDDGVETRIVGGVWQKVLHVSPGTYQYRLIVDGQWQEDPHNPHHVVNEYGEANSLLQVQERDDAQGR